MSRSGSVAALLGDPELRVQAVAPSGDCFYEAIALALASVGEGVGQVEGETATAALRRFVKRRRWRPDSLLGIPALSAPTGSARAAPLWWSLTSLTQTSSPSRISLSNNFLGLDLLLCRSCNIQIGS